MDKKWLSAAIIQQLFGVFTKTAQLRKNYFIPNQNSSPCGGCCFYLRGFGIACASRERFHGALRVC